MRVNTYFYTYFDTLRYQNNKNDVSQRSNQEKDQLRCFA